MNMAIAATASMRATMSFCVLDVGDLAGACAPPRLPCDPLAPEPTRREFVALFWAAFGLRFEGI
jgi:hypothetical protein